MKLAPPPSDTVRTPDPPEKSTWPLEKPSRSITSWPPPPSIVYVAPTLACVKAKTSPKLEPITRSMELSVSTPAPPVSCAAATVRSTLTDPEAVA